jgi:radical SAM-linked protein
MAKRPEAKYVSHLDFQRALERALRRAELPIALSQGFNPHPRFSFASAAAVGITSDAEFVDFELSTAVDPDEFKARLNEGLPLGFRVLDAREAAPGGPGLMAELDTAEYRLGLEFPDVAPDLAPTVAAFLNRKDVVVEKQGKKGSRPVNIRPLTYHLAADEPQGCLVWLTAVLAAGSGGTLRPEDLIRGLELVDSMVAGGSLIHIHKATVFKRAGDRMVSAWDIG